MTPEQEKELDQKIRDVLEKVRLNSMRNGARMICGAVLGYAKQDGTDSEKLKAIVDFCNTTLDKATVDEVT